MPTPPSPSATADLMDAPIACSLGSSDLDRRLEEWRRLLTGVTSRADEPAAVVLHLDAGTSISDLAALCADEVACCPFFTFDLHLTATSLTLTATAPESASVLLTDLFQPI